MKDYVREHRHHRREMFVPLTHPPWHAQADFSEAWAVIAGVKQKVHFFAFDLPQSDASYVRAYEPTREGNGAEREERESVIKRIVANAPDLRRRTSTREASGDTG